MTPFATGLLQLTAAAAPCATLPLDFASLGVRFLLHFVEATSARL